MVSRIIVTSYGSSTVSRKIVKIISDPTGPLIILTASSKDIPSKLCPSTAVIRSPDFIPARNAGVSSIGETTFT